jgi:hypothetical protein
MDQLGMVGEDTPTDETKLRPGNLIHLFDEELSLLNDGFESVHTFGMLGYPAQCEMGFHICSLRVDLFVITKFPHPVSSSMQFVAIPNHLLHHDIHLDIFRYNTIGQYLSPDGLYVLPCKRPWEEDAEWEHKEIECIRAWKEGKYPTLELEWSRFNDRK